MQSSNDGWLAVARPMRIHPLFMNFVGLMYTSVRFKWDRCNASANYSGFFSPIRPPTPPPSSPSAAAEKADAKASKEEVLQNNLKLKEMTADRDKKMQALKEEHAYLESQYMRNERLREVSLRHQEQVHTCYDKIRTYHTPGYRVFHTVWPSILHSVEYVAHTYHMFLGLVVSIGHTEVLGKPALMRT